MVKAAHQAGDWDIVASINNKEFLCKAKWHLERGLASKEEQAVFAGMLNGGKAAPDDDGSSAGRAHKHVHRKHRRNCPKHASHSKARGSTPAEIVTMGLSSAAAQPTTADDALRKAEALGGKFLLDKPPQPLLPGLPVPHTVGRGLTSFLTGSYPGDAYKWEHRQRREHPDFRVASQLPPKELLPPKAAPTTGWSRVSAPPRFVPNTGPPPRTPELGKSRAGGAIEPDGHFTLLRVPISKKDFRKKDDLKTLAEHAASSGKIMMRGK
jgi:hypothetical protein